MPDEDLNNLWAAHEPSRFDLFSPERYIKHCGLLSYEERIRQFQQNALRVMPVEDGDINE